MKPKILCFLLIFAPLLPAPAAVIFPLGSTWKYFVGTQEASSPPSAWHAIGFNDSGWPAGPGAIGYPSVPPGVFEATIQTTLPTSTVSNYLTVFCRRAFVMSNVIDVTQLALTLRIDDGYAAWLNDTLIGSNNVPEGSLAFNLPAPVATTEDVELGLTVSPNLLVDGTNVLAIQVFQAGTGSTDLVMDATLTATRDDPPVVESVFPAAGAAITGLTFINVVFSENVAGVDAADLTINTTPATGMLVVSPREYQFNFPQPPTGTVTIAWASAHGIVDIDGNPQPFTGGGWSYTLQTNAIPSTIRLNEFMANNNNGIKDDDGTRSDWIELYNPGPLDANLDGWFLTDTATNLTAWRIPSLFLGANKYALIWASMKDRANPAAPLHTNFKLGSGGGYLALVDPQTNIVSQFNPYPGQQADVSYGRDQVDSSLLGYFTTPTPGAQNSTRGPGFVGEPVFSLNSGIYTNTSLTLTLVNTNGFGTIRYTTDQSVPTAASTAYSAPIPLSANSTIKARIFPPAGTNLFPSAVVARNFVFLDSTSTNFTSRLPMLIISTEGRPIPQDVVPGGQRAKGSLVVIDTFRGQSSIRGESDFQELAAFEIFGQTSAGFVKKPIRIEIQDSIGNDLDRNVLGMPANADWRLRNPYNDKTLLNDFLGYGVWEKMGHYSVRRRLVEVFIDTTGGRLVYPGDYYGVMMLCETIKVDKDRVDIAKLSPYATNGPAVTGGYIFKRDKDSLGDLNFSSPGGLGFSAIPLHLHEPKPNELRYAQGTTTSFPGAGYTPAGTNQMNYLRDFLGAMERAMYTNTWLTQTGTNHYTNFVDVERFADQMLHVEFTKQIDGYRLSDYFSKDRLGRLGPGPVWDWNLAYGNADYLAGGQTNGWYYEAAGDADHPWARRLITGTASSTTSTGDPNFTQLVADRWAMFRTNVLNGTNVLAEIDDLSTLLSQAAARDLYGKYRAGLIGVYTWPNPNGTADGRDVDFVNPTNYVGPIETVAPARATNSIIGQMKKWVLGRYLWIDSQFTGVPTFSTSQGMVGMVPNGSTVLVTPPQASTLYYTLNGTDPRASGGTVLPGALSNNGPVTITVTSNMHIVARAKSAGAWKGTFSGPAAVPLYTTIPSLRITEIMYHPAPPPSGTNTEDFEYIELKNIGAVPLNLAGYTISGGVDFTFPNVTLNAAERVLVVANLAAFMARYGPGFNIAGQYTGNLDNAGERLILQGRYREPILDFEYKDGWYPITDGFGFSLVVVDELAAASAWGTKAQWHASGTLHGTPGLAEGAAASFPQVVINEALTHSDTNLVPGQVDTIELRNLSGGDAAIGGWFLTDDLNAPMKFRIPNGTVISAGGFRTFTENDYNTGTGGNVPFALSSQGDEVYLFSGDAGTNLTGYVHGFDFGPQFKGRTFGRYVTSSGEDQFVAQSSPSLGTNNSGPLVGPIVLSEIQYHPVDVVNQYGTFDNTEDEFIELENITGVPQPLYDPLFPTNTWRVRDAVSFTFPTNVTLPAGGHVLLVSFDPVADPLAEAAFRSRNGVFAGAPIFGPYGGKLDNSEDTVELVQPDAPINGSVAYVVADKVRYSHASPWPADADGLGFSLQRIVPGGFGNDATNWSASLKTPGLRRSGGNGPVFTEQPRSLSVLDTLPAGFSVTAIGARPIQYQWLFGNSGIDGASNSVYTIPSVTAANAGTYRCIAQTARGATFSSNATLTVLALSAISPGYESGIPGSPSVLSHPTNRTVLGGAGYSSTFSVLASGDTPRSYRWLYNSSVIPNATNATLILPDIQVGQQGNYRCIVVNNIGYASTSNAFLTVLQPLQISQQPTNKEVRVRPDPGTDVLPNTNAAILVIATSMNPPLTFQWRMNGTNLPPSPHYSNVYAATLIISNVTMADFGAYSCELNDGVGRIFSSNATLFPLVRPTIQIPFPNQTQTVAAGSSFAVSAVLSSGWPPPFGYQWRSSGSTIITNLVSDSKTNFFVYPKSAVSSSAVTGALYRVVVTNRASPAVLINTPFYITTLLDTDHDGIPDSVESALGLDPNSAADALLDLDGDGMSNLAEYQAGTDPANAASYLKMEHSILPGTASLRFAAVSNRTYTILFSGSLVAGSWSPLADFVAFPTNRVEVVIDPDWPTNRFYRVVTPRLP